MMSLRIGQGFDVHAFGEQAQWITLGGVRVPCERRLLAHSDGDVLLHALCDALLGSLALGDIGTHFPDTDPQYAAADSRVLLRRVMALLREQSAQLVNLDCTLIAQKPRMAPYIPAMRETIAADCELAPTRVSIKATTTEGLGFTGRGEGIACQAIVLVTLPE